MKTKTQYHEKQFRTIDRKSFERVVSKLEMETSEFSERLLPQFHGNEEEPYVLMQTIWLRVLQIGKESYNRGKTRTVSPISTDGSYFCINTGVVDGDNNDIYLLMGNSTPIQTVTWFTCNDKRYTDLFSVLPARCASQRRKNRLNFYIQHDHAEPARVTITSVKEKEKAESLCKRYCPSEFNMQAYIAARIKEAFMKARSSINAFIPIDDGITFEWMFPVSFHMKYDRYIDCFATVHINPSGRCYITRVMAPDEAYCFANISESKSSRQEPLLKGMLIKMN